MGFYLDFQDVCIGTREQRSSSVILKTDVCLGHLDLNLRPSVLPISIRFLGHVCTLVGLDYHKVAATCRHALSVRCYTDSHVLCACDEQPWLQTKFLHRFLLDFWSWSKRVIGFTYWFSLHLALFFCFIQCFVFFIFLITPQTTKVTHEAKTTAFCTFGRSVGLVLFVSMLASATWTPCIDIKPFSSR